MSNNTPWTPGPWVIDDEMVVDPKRFAVAEVHWSQLFVDYDKSRHPSDDPDWSRDLSDVEMEANARLISKAPEMVELLPDYIRALRELGFEQRASRVAALYSYINGEDNA